MARESIEDMFGSSSARVRTTSPDIGGERTSGGADKRKQSLYFPEGMLQEMKAEAERLDRSLSWVVQRAWKIAKGEIGDLQGVGSADE